MLKFKGYEIYETKNIENLKYLKKVLSEIIKNHFDISEKDNDIVLNKLHELIPKISDAKFNEKRMKIISDLNSEIDVGQIIFDSFYEQIIKLLGPDILVQKNTNLVLQMPNDANPSEIHRDAPGNSCYELVVWVPLVDCYNTKAMYILDYENTKLQYKHLKNKMDWSSFETKSIELSKKPRVNFGQALFFSAAVLHGSEINKENETRISLNIRFKNIFSPSGFKNQFQFFKRLKVSDFTLIGSDLEFEVMKNSL